MSYVKTSKVGKYTTKEWLDGTKDWYKEGNA